MWRCIDNLFRLLTNAVAAARVMERVSPVRLWLLADNSQIVILVWDANPESPVRTQIDDEAESGRGLVLVEALSSRWGWYSTQGTAGKTVWASITFVSDRRQDDAEGQHLWRDKPGHTVTDPALELCGTRRVGEWWEGGGRAREGDSCS